MCHMIISFDNLSMIKIVMKDFTLSSCPKIIAFLMKGKLIKTKSVLQRFVLGFTVMWQHRVLI